MLVNYVKKKDRKTFFMKQQNLKLPYLRKLFILY